MVYGPGNKGNMLTLLKAAHRKIPLPLGCALGKRSMVYIGNICHAIETILKCPDLKAKACEIYYPTDSEEKTSAELYNAIFLEMNGRRGVFPVPVFFIKLAAFLLPQFRKTVSRLFDDYVFSSLKFQHDFKWKPPYAFKDAIRNTVQWYRTIH
jgi:UDP-glucose 4-epimerase